MFGNRFFGGHYFGQNYFGGGTAEVIEIVGAFVCAAITMFPAVDGTLSITQIAGTPSVEKC